MTYDIVAVDIQDTHITQMLVRYNYLKRYNV